MAMLPLSSIFGAAKSASIGAAKSITAGAVNQITGLTPAQAVRMLPVAAQFIRDVTTISPTQAAAQNTIVARAYVEESLSTLDVIPKILKAIQVSYAGMIITILDRSNEIVSGSTVGDQLNKVYTRSMGYESVHVDVGGGLHEMAAGVESLNGGGESTFIAGTEDDGDGDDGARFSTDPKELKITPAELLPVGQVMRVTLSGKDGDGKVIRQDVTLTVKVTPFITSDQSMALILENGAKPSFRIRKLQLQAGEISFWRDFVFQADRIKKIEDAARSDKTGAYNSFLNDTSGRDRDRVLDLIYNLSTPKALSANLANTVIVCSEETLLRAKAATGVDLTKDDARNDFFKASYVMMLVVVDPHYHRVTMYLNGFVGPHNYTFDDFNPKKKMDASDIMQMLAASGQAGNRSGRF